MSKSALPFIRHLLSATTNATLYGMDHPQVHHLLDLAATSFKELTVSQSEIVIDVIDSEIIIGRKPQPSSVHLSRFASMLSSRGVGHMRLTCECTLQEMASLVRSLSVSSEKVEQLISSENIRLGIIEVRMGNDGSDSDKSACSKKRLSIADLPAIDISNFMEIYEAARRRKKLKITGIFDVVSGFVEVFNDGGAPLLVLASLRETDEYTFTHSANVSILTIAQAKALGISGGRLHEIGVAALLHDIGKIFVPEEILTKKDKLTEEEFAIMREHPVRGARYLLDTPGVPRLAVLGAFEHHLKYNVSGYPQTSPDWGIKSCSHMIMIADFFDALRTRRPYREPVELDTIVTMMRDMSGTEFHPFFSRNFLTVISNLDQTVNAFPA